MQIGRRAVRDYESLVSLAARGMSERDNHPMPVSVTTPEDFYKVMARAALDAIDLPSLVERKTERDQRIIENSLRRIGNSLKNSRPPIPVPMRAPHAEREMAGPDLNTSSFASTGKGSTSFLSSHLRPAPWKRRIAP